MNELLYTQRIIYIIIIVLLWDYYTEVTITTIFLRMTVLVKIISVWDTPPTLVYAGPYSWSIEEIGSIPGQRFTWCSVRHAKKKMSVKYTLHNQHIVF